MYERSANARHNSAVVIGVNGELINGTVLGTSCGHFRKCHVPDIDNPPDTQAWERFFFSPGSSLPVFQTDKALIGILICYDRWFPEAWRLLVAQGAEVIVVPMVAWGFVESTYLAM